MISFILCWNCFLEGFVYTVNKTPILRPWICTLRFQQLHQDVSFQMIVEGYFMVLTPSSRTCPLSWQCWVLVVQVWVTYTLPEESIPLKLFRLGVWKMTEKMELFLEITHSESLLVRGRLGRVPWQQGLVSASPPCLLAQSFCTGIEWRHIQS